MKTQAIAKRDHKMCEICSLFRRRASSFHSEMYCNIFLYYWMYGRCFVHCYECVMSHEPWAMASRTEIFGWVRYGWSFGTIFHCVCLCGTQPIHLWITKPKLQLKLYVNELGFPMWTFVFCPFRSNRSFHFHLRYGFCRNVHCVIHIGTRISTTMPDHFDYLCILTRRADFCVWSFWGRPKICWDLAVHLQTHHGQWWMKNVCLFWRIFVHEHITHHQYAMKTKQKKCVLHHHGASRHLCTIWKSKNGLKTKLNCSKHHELYKWLQQPASTLNRILLFG